MNIKMCHSTEGSMEVSTFAESLTTLLFLVVFH
ncbi:hypothetical protein E2C01_090990 [Portunus trituberculatus]|uniref:Uncharacterized protein n=1 Tax=Portunus trituberculatus TaxID=210409 RepID=A0A5B7JTV9_PORTR|nr:hypothetical protein [Portunus trituberculatus]